MEMNTLPTHFSQEPLNLGRHFSFDRDLWPDLVQPIEAILSGQRNLFKLPKEIETAAQHYAALIIQSRADGHDLINDKQNRPDCHSVDINSLEMIRPRNVGIEHVGLETLKALKKELGFNKHELSAAIGTIIGRMAVPGSELATHYWLRTGLGELIGYDYETVSLTRLYQVSDLILKNKESLEKRLYERERCLFNFEETITLYDLTNTYVEGSGKFNFKVWQAFLFPACPANVQSHCLTGLCFTGIGCFYPVNRYCLFTVDVACPQMINSMKPSKIESLLCKAASPFWDQEPVSLL